MKADLDKTTAITEVVSSHPEKMSIITQNGVETPAAPDKNRWRTEKMSCKSYEADRK
jgi:hypothetical protein